LLTPLPTLRQKSGEWKALSVGVMEILPSSRFDRISQGRISDWLPGLGGGGAPLLAALVPHDIRIDHSDGVYSRSHEVEVDDAGRI